MFDNLSIVKTPAAARRLFPAALWKIRAREKKIYLTFDDGPIEEVTPQVLDILKQYNATATFFCIGKNIHAHPDIFQRLMAEGHTVGNHTQDHPNGWYVENDFYFENVARARESMMRYRDREPNRIFFRPPYGKLTLPQYNKLKKLYKIVMWDVLSFDFDLKISKEQVLENVLKNAVAGSIIVFHDSLKAKEKVLYALPLVLEHYSHLGYQFESLRE
jgi:peptidoglycan/xylan/chitin deacetylase (PgdA/CDA1 family)